MAEDRFTKADKVKDVIDRIDGKIDKINKKLDKKVDGYEYEKEKRYKHCGKCPCGASKRDDSGDAEDHKPNTVKVNTVKSRDDSKDSDSSEDEDGQPSKYESELDNPDFEGWGYTSTEEDD